jgi:hypothetical protein
MSFKAVSYCVHRPSCRRGNVVVPSLLFLVCRVQRPLPCLACPSSSSSSSSSSSFSPCLPHGHDQQVGMRTKRSIIKGKCPGRPSQKNRGHAHPVQGHGETITTTRVQAPPLLLLAPRTQSISSDC